MFFAVYQANSSRSACTRKGHGSNLVHARAFHTGYSQAHWGFSDCCFEVDKDIRQNTLWKTCARWCHHCWTRRNVALSRVKKNKLWIWKAYRRETGELIDWECGGRDKGTLSKLMERLSRWKVELFCTDNWGVYPEVIVADKLYQSKSQTVYLEQNNGRQRHWFARFRRKSIVVSKTLEMVDLTMALFARFHVNGSWKDIASLFSWHPPILYGLDFWCHPCDLLLIWVRCSCQTATHFWQIKRSLIIYSNLKAFLNPPIGGGGLNQKKKPGTWPGFFFYSIVTLFNSCKPFFILL